MSACTNSTTKTLASWLTSHPQTDACAPTYSPLPPLPLTCTTPPPPPPPHMHLPPHPQVKLEDIFDILERESFRSGCTAPITVAERANIKPSLLATVYDFWAKKRARWGEGVRAFVCGKV